MAKSLQTAVVLCLTPLHHDAICRRAAKMPSARLEVVGGDDMSVVCAIRLEVAGRRRVRIGRLKHCCRVTVVCAARLGVLERALRVGEACVVRLAPGDGLDRRAAVVNTMNRYSPSLFEGARLM